MKMLDKNLLLYLSLVSTVAAGSKGCDNPVKRTQDPAVPAAKGNPNPQPTSGSRGHSSISQQNPKDPRDPVASGIQHPKDNPGPETPPPADPKEDPFDTLKGLCEKISNNHKAIISWCEARKEELKLTIDANFNITNLSITGFSIEQFFSLYEVVKKRADELESMLKAFRPILEQFDKDKGASDYAEKQKFIKEFRADYTAIQEFFDKMHPEFQRRKRAGQTPAPNQAKVNNAQTVINNADTVLFAQVQALFTAVGVLHTEVSKPAVKGVDGVHWDADNANAPLIDSLNHLDVQNLANNAPANITDARAAEGTFSINVVGPIRALTTGVAVGAPRRLKAQFDAAFQLFIDIEAFLNAVFQASVDTNALIPPARSNYEKSLEIEAKAAAYKNLVDGFRDKVAGIDARLDGVKMFVDNMNNVAAAAAVGDRERDAARDVLRPQIQGMIDVEGHAPFDVDQNKIMLYLAFLGKQCAFNGQPAAGMFQDIRQVNSANRADQKLSLNLWLVAQLRELDGAAGFAEVKAIQGKIEHIHKSFYAAVAEEKACIVHREALQSKILNIRGLLGLKQDKQAKIDLCDRFIGGINPQQRQQDEVRNNLHDDITGGGHRAVMVNNLLKVESFLHDKDRAIPDANLAAIDAIKKDLDIIYSQLSQANVWDAP